MWGKERKKERKEKGTTAVMFYEMILFCSLAEVVGAIISLAEINTGKASHFSGAAAAGVPHCHLATRALEAEAAGSRSLLHQCPLLPSTHGHGTSFPSRDLQPSLKTAELLGL